MLGLALLAGACAGSAPPSAVARPVGEDLVALVPSGAEVLLDVDVVQVRGWDATDRLLALLPPAGQARLRRLGPTWLGEIDALVVAAWRGERGDDTVVLLRGDLDDERLPGLFDADVPVTRGELGGKVLLEGGGLAVLRLAPRVVVVGTPVEVRRVADVIRGDLQGVRDAKADRPLREALARAPSARTGRPAVLGAALGGPLLQERLVAAGVGGAPPRAASLAVALGDGLDAVLVLQLGSAPEAATLRQDVDRALRDLRARPVVRLLGLGDLFDVATVAREREVRLAYRIGAARLETFLRRMDEGRRALEAMKPGAAPAP